MRATDEIRSLMSSADPAADAVDTRQASADELIARATDTDTTVRSRPTRRRMWSLVGAGALTMAAAAAVVVPIAGDHGVKPAYAVTVQHNGDVRVDIKALNNVADFEHQMRRAGVPTEVESLPAGKTCKNLGQRYLGVKFVIRKTDPRTHVGKLTSFLITPSDIKKGQTLVLEAHGTRVTNFYIADAPYRCVPVRW